MNFTHRNERDQLFTWSLFVARCIFTRNTQAESTNVYKALDSTTFNRLKLLCACVLFLPLFAHAQNQSWENWLSSQINKHPNIIAAKEQLFSTGALAEASEQALYNPELSTDYARNGDNNDYSVGIEQTIDLWDRQGARRQKAGFMRTAAQAQYQEVVLNKSADAIDALINWHAAKRAASIAKSQQQQLNSLLELVEIRQEAGDLGSIDAELTFLSLSKQFAQVAGSEAQLQMAEAIVRELLPDWEPERGRIPDEFWPSKVAYPSDEELLKHPKIAKAYAQWLTQKEEAEVTRRNAKANPTFGINAGREERENVVGLTFSIPLNIRNNYSAETRSAERMALETEARFRAQYQKLRFDLQGAFGAWQSYNQQFSQWQSLVKSRIESSANLLEKQWRSGDLSTTNYLLALNQRAESLLSGIELEKQTRIALKNLMLQSGRLIDLPPVQHDFSIDHQD